MIALRGDTVLQQRNEGTRPSINDRINNISADQRFSLSRPTQTHVDTYNIATGEFTQELAKLKALVEESRQVESEMEKLGSPYTPGRFPVWSDEN
jgi:hypothetical protein